MSIAYAPDLPPPPQGMSLLDATILREQLQEDTLQVLGKFILANAGAGADGPVIDVTSADYGAVGDGIADDTEAFQTALDQLSSDLGDLGTATGGVCGTIYVPNGLYKITSTLTYYGRPSVSIRIRGDIGLTRGEYEGTCLFWAGAAGGTILDLQAVNGSVIEDISFDGGTLARYLVRGREWHDSVTYSTFAGTSGVHFYRCKFTNPGSYTDSVLVAAGTTPIAPDFNTYQADSFSFWNCFFQGHNELGNEGYGFKALAGGNCKNFAFYECKFGDVYQGIYSVSGTLVVLGGSAANISYGRAGGTAIYFGGNSATVSGFGMENSNPGFCATFMETGFASKTTIQNCYVAGSFPAFVVQGISPGVGIAVAAGGSVSIINCDFERDSRASATTIAWAGSTAYAVGHLRRNGTNMYECLVAGTSAGAGGPSGTSSSGIVDGTCEWGYRGLVQGDQIWIRGQAALTTAAEARTTTYQTLNVLGSKFKWLATEYAGPPVTDGSGNWLGGGDYAKGTEHAIMWYGNTYGAEAPALDSAWYPQSGSVIKVLSKCVWTDANTAGVTIVREEPGHLVVSIPYTAVQTAFLTKTLQFCQIPKRWKVRQVILDYTTPFAHPTGTITAKVGHDTDDDNFLIDATATGQVGITDASLGAGLSGNPIVGCTPSWTAMKDCKIVFTSSSGNLSGLTAGALTLHFFYEDRKA
jgi:hypothetical protein